MEHLKNTLALVIAVLLQWSLRSIAPPLAFVDFPLIVITYIALQRESLRAMLYATLAGVAVDALSGGLLGAGGFSKTLTAFVIAEFARRVLILDNPLLRIPVLAVASLASNSIYFVLNKMLGQETGRPLLETLMYSMIATTIVGTIIMLIVQFFFSERARQRRGAAPRRQQARRNTIRMGRRF